MAPASPPTALRNKEGGCHQNSAQAGARQGGMACDHTAFLMGAAGVPSLKLHPPSARTPHSTAPPTGPPRSPAQAPASLGTGSPSWQST